MFRIIAFVTLSLFIESNANAQVVCTRTGDQIFCNGSLQQPRPARQRQVYLDPHGSYQRGYKTGVLDELHDIYFSGRLKREQRDMFLADIAKNGGDVIWFRNDMVIKDQQQSLIDSSVNSGSAATPSVPEGSTTPQTKALTVAERLRELDSLLKSGSISQNEYDAKRKEILGSL